DGEDQRDSCAGARRPDARAGSGVDSRGGSIRFARGSRPSPGRGLLRISRLDHEAAMGTIHQPVLLDQGLAWVGPPEGSILLDGTAGGGGHTAALAARVGTTGRVIGLDRDPAMLDLAREAVGEWPVTMVHAPYADMGRVLAGLGVDRVQGVLVDLGLS